eukprot:1141976-Pelagomonas_calceolata.AAC.7
MSMTQGLPLLQARDTFLTMCSRVLPHEPHTWGRGLCGDAASAGRHTGRRGRCDRATPRSGHGHEKDVILFLL